MDFSDEKNDHNGNGNGNGKSGAGLGGGLHLLDRLVDINLSESQISRVLEERAATLAKIPGDSQRDTVFKEYVTFHLGEEKYGFDVQLVEEIQLTGGLTKIPCTPDFVVGAVNVRGCILPVLDVKSLFNLPATDSGNAGKIIVISSDKIRMGILADSVDEVLDIGANEISSQISTLSGATEEFIDGVTNEGVIILDMASLAADKRLIIHEDV